MLRKDTAWAITTIPFLCPQEKSAGGMAGGRTLSAQAYEFLKERILHGAYRSGQKTPSLRETAEALCVSRNTAERACEQLLAEGFLRCRRKSGYFTHTDPAAFPLTTWRRLTNAALSWDDAVTHNRYCEPLGHGALRREIARYVFDSRGVV